MLVYCCCLLCVSLGFISDDVDNVLAVCDNVFHIVFDPPACCRIIHSIICFMFMNAIRNVPCRSSYSGVDGVDGACVVGLHDVLNAVLYNDEGQVLTILNYFMYIFLGPSTFCRLDGIASTTQSTHGTTIQLIVKGDREIEFHNVSCCAALARVPAMC